MDTIIGEPLQNGMFESSDALSKLSSVHDEDTVTTAASKSVIGRSITKDTSFSEGSVNELEGKPANLIERAYLAAEALHKLGFSNKEIAGMVGIGEATIYRLRVKEVFPSEQLVNNLEDAVSAACQTRIRTVIDILSSNEKSRANSSGRHKKRYVQSWSQVSSVQNSDEKELIAEYFANHDFLVAKGKNPETDSRETVATIIINQGNTPNVVVEHCLEWVKKNWNRGPFDLTFFTPGHLIPATLRSFREENPRLLKSTQLFLFPGFLDLDVESFCGKYTETFVNKLKTNFSYTFLSARSFNIRDGAVNFHYPGEICLQRAIATRYAEHKYLFLDTNKFTIEGKGKGDFGYGIDELLGQGEALTIYTVSSEKNEEIIKHFEALCENILDNETGLGVSKKSLKLQLVGKGDFPSLGIQREGILKNLRGKSHRNKR